MEPFKLYEHFPHSAFSALPSDEQESARFAKEHLMALSTMILRLSHGLELADYVDSQVVDAHQKRLDLYIEERKDSPQSRSFDSQMKLAGDFQKTTELQSKYVTWMQIIARDMAMTIHDFHRSMSGTVKNVNNAPTLKTRMNKRLIDDAQKMFTKYFPNAKDIRHAAGHPSDFFATPDDMAKNAAKGPAEIPGIMNATAGASYVFDCSIFNRRVIYTNGGNTLTFELTTQTTERLTEIKTAFYRSFKGPTNTP